MVYGARLESVLSASSRGFKSLTLRHVPFGTFFEIYSSFNLNLIKYILKTIIKNALNLSLDLARVWTGHEGTSD